MDKVVRVLIVDDSAYVRKVVREMLERSPFIEVVGAARDGREALELVEKLRPDVVTLDLIMPELDGVGFLKEQMRRAPLPVLILSIAGDSSEMGLAALDAGAVDFIQKPTALATDKLFEVNQDLVEKVKAAARLPLARLPLEPPPTPAEPLPLPPVMDPARLRADVCVIGISTGGPQALRYLIPRLPAEFPVPLAIVLHMPVGYTEMYADRLGRESALEVVEAKGGERLRPGLVILAQAGRHLYLERAPDGAVVTRLDARPLDTLHRPAVDVLFRSAAEVYHDRVLAVVMTGMGEDGREGAAWVKSQGGTVLTEAESSCVVYGMPRAVVEAGLSDRSVLLEHLAEALRDEVLAKNAVAQANGS